MNKIRKEIINVLKELLINEEMITSSNFINNKWSKQNNAIVLEIGIDDENEVQNRLNLIISFGSPSGYNELSFYFNITNKENTEITSNPKSIYDREITKKYLPKVLTGKYIFIEKIKKMLKELLNMDTPDKFFMETFEDHTSRKQIDYYDNLVRIITDNGYLIESQGINPVSKKYFWQFLRKDLNKPLSENVQKHWNDFNLNIHTKRDNKYWENQNKEAEDIIKKYNNENK